MSFRTILMNGFVFVVGSNLSRNYKFSKNFSRYLLICSKVLKVVNLYSLNFLRILQTLHSALSSNFHTTIKCQHPPTLSSCRLFWPFFPDDKKSFLAAHKNSEKIQIKWILLLDSKLNWKLCPSLTIINQISSPSFNFTCSDPFGFWIEWERENCTIWPEGARDFKANEKINFHDWHSDTLNYINK